MKLLYVITSLDTGGAEKALSSLVLSMKREHQVKVVCLKTIGSVGKNLQQQGVEVVSLCMQGAGLGTVTKLVQEIENFQPHVVHAMLFRAIEFSRLACAGRGVKLVTTPHFDISQKPTWMRWLDRCLKRMDSLSTAESVSTYNYLLQHQHYPRAKTLFIGNSVKKSLFFKDNSIRETMRLQNGFLPKDVIFISVGRLASVKNPRGLLSAFAQIIPHCPHAKLVFVGEGPERTFLENFIAENKLKDRVLLVGEQTNINHWLNMADVFVLLSKEESLPLALLEAKNAGLPCLVSQVGDMPLQIKHGKNGFVCKSTDNMLASCLLTELYDNASLREEMGKISLQETADEEQSFQQYQQVYQQLCNN